MKWLNRSALTIYIVGIILTAVSYGLGLYSSHRMGLYRSLYYHNANLLSGIAMPMVLYIVLGLVTLSLVIKVNKFLIIRGIILIAVLAFTTYLQVTSSFLGTGLMIVSSYVMTLGYFMSYGLAIRKMFKPQ